MADELMVMECGPLILAHLYPHTSSLEGAVQILAAASCPVVLPADPPTYKATCCMTVVAYQRPRQLEEWAGLAGGSLRGCETRQRKAERKSPSLMLKSILLAVKNVSIRNT